MKRPPWSTKKHKEVFHMSEYLDNIVKKVKINEKKRWAKYWADKRAQNVLPEEKTSEKAISLAERRKQKASKLTEIDQLAFDRWEEKEEEFKKKFEEKNELLDYLSQYPNVPFDIYIKPNARKLRVTNRGVTIDSTTEFNAVKNACERFFNERIVFTASGAIPKKGNIIRERWGIRYSGQKVELIIISFRGMWRFQYRGSGKKKTTEYGTQAWKEFSKECKKQGVNLEEIAVSPEEGSEIKKQIPKPDIRLLNDAFLNIELEGVNHIDIHKAHPYYISQAFPQLKPIYEKYDRIVQQAKLAGDKRTANKFKNRMDVTSGYSESRYSKFRFAKMALAAKTGTNAKVAEMITELKTVGNTPILTNTDGVWYLGPVHKFNNEGNAMGQLETDHIGCRLRIRSKGAYEFIENGKYHVAMRGRSAYDLLKPREEWEWGDIYKTDGILKFPFNPETEEFEIKIDSLEESEI